MFRLTCVHLCPWGFNSTYNLTSHSRVVFVCKSVILHKGSPSYFTPICYSCLLNVFPTFDGHISNSFFSLFPPVVLTVTPGHRSQYKLPKLKGVWLPDFWITYTGALWFLAFLQLRVWYHLIDSTIPSEVLTQWNPQECLKREFAIGIYYLNFRKNNTF